MQTILESTTTTDGRHGFDPLLGTWTIANERLRSRLSNCTEWLCFDADSTCLPILGGIGNIDDFRPIGDVPEMHGFEGGALRIFNGNTGLWAIHWFDNGVCSLIPPMSGTFNADGSVGTFFSDEEFEGRPIRVRFLWFMADPDHLRWEQAFSPDGGANWETNWIMRFTRVESDPASTA